MKLKNLFIIACAGSLLGCTTHKELTYTYITTNSAPVSDRNPAAQNQLAEAAVDVNHSLQQISAIRLALYPGVKPPAVLDPVITGMTQETSLDWSGPVEPLLKRIATASHYKLRVLGQQPPIPVLVAIHMNRVPLADILRNTAYQISQKAHLTVYPATKIIELRYDPT